MVSGVCVCGNDYNGKVIQQGDAPVTQCSGEVVIPFTTWRLVSLQGLSDQEMSVRTFDIHKHHTVHVCRGMCVGV